MEVARYPVGTTRCEAWLKHLGLDPAAVQPNSTHFTVEADPAEGTYVVALRFAAAELRTAGFPWKDDETPN